ncbi:MAG: thioredoxin domain-containing protein [Flavobacteriaceae bacterium]|nr:MAG: thioredoxin domain-containing protein [Flavobacteriaceae bacterium]
MENHKYTNDLIHESSPYLLQHAHNPVNWKAWNQETLDLAKKENKLLLISIGYSSCHWCHVMEHESFEDEEVAAIMNAHFICIKIDREERPDIDQVYMDAVQLITGRGGWPLNCIALPNGKPFWGGTYFPKDNWMHYLKEISNLYKSNPDKVAEHANKLTEGVKYKDVVSLNTEEFTPNMETLNLTVENWQTHMDYTYGGRTGAPKFPMPHNFDFLLRYAVQNNDDAILEFVNTSLTNITQGGINDQLRGGFARYSTDKKWHVPHFEKMLYDNGQLVSVYANAYAATKNELYKETVYETLAFIQRELLTKEGAFYSSLDADSLTSTGELEEGAYYVWDKVELKSLLKNDFELFAAYYNINSKGFWEHGYYVLCRKGSDSSFIKSHHLNLAQLESKKNEWKKTLQKAQEKRSRPRLDDKILTSWNALMLKGYIDAYKVFEDADFLKTALKNASFLKTKQLQESGSINHTYKEGKSTINGYLEDYATVIDAFIALYEVTLDEQWLDSAKKLTDYSFDHFFNSENHLFFFTSDQDQALIARKIDIDDNVISSSNSIMARNLYKLSHYYSNSYYLKTSKQMLSNVIEKAISYGAGYANWLQLYCDLTGSFYEIAITGPDAKAFTKEINKHYLPNKILAAAVDNSRLPILEGRFTKGGSQLFICVDGACKLPVNTVKEALNLVELKFE